MTAQAGSIAEKATETQTADGTSAPRRRRRGVARWRISAAVSAIVIGLLLSQAVAFAIIMGFGGYDDVPDGIRAVAVIAGDLVILGVVLRFARRGAEHLGAATLGIRRTKFGPALGWMLVIYVGVVALEGVWLLFVAALGGIHRSGAGQGLAHVSTGAALALVFGIAVLAPIGEEIAFRGYLFPALTRWRGPWIGAALTALLFGAAHAFAYPPPLLPLMAIFGFGSCLLYWFTGSLLPSVALHALNNGIATALIFGLGWGVLLVPLGSVALALLVLAPFARERAPGTEVVA